jgi:tetratricopeptide (TPR) repeat protein
MRALRHRVAVALLLALAPAVTLAQNQARMSGVVTDHEGNPVKDAVVKLQPKDDKGTSVDATSKKKGNYLIGMIRPGAYNLLVDAPGGLVVLRLKGRATDPLENDKVLWEVDQEFAPDQLPPINVGYMNQIHLDVVVGPMSLTAAAKAEAEAKKLEDLYASGLAKIRSGNYEEGLALLEKPLEGTPDHAGTNYLAAFALTQLGRYETALPRIDKCLSVDPSFSGAHVLRGRILKGLGRDDEAEREFRSELDGSFDAAVKMEAAIGLAILYEDTNRLADAIATLEAASEFDSRREVLLKLSDLYSQSGDREKAYATLERAEKEGGMDDVALLNLAIGYINDRNYSDAERLANRLVEKGSDPKNLSLAHSILARCDLNRGKLDDGAQHLRTALALDPDSSLAAENREILAALGK